MQSFIVLGIVPGTHFELTFNYWLILAGMLCVVLFRDSFFAAARRMRIYFVARQIAHAIDEFNLIAL